MRIGRILPLLGALPLAGCLLLSGQFLVTFEIPDPLDIASPLGVVPIQIDLNTEEAYRDHKDGIASADAALLGELENPGPSQVAVEFWLTADLTTYVTANQVRSDPTAVRVWGPITLGPGETRLLGWDESADLFTGRQAVLDQIRGDGDFTLYGIGSTAARLVLHHGAVVVIIDGKV